MISPLKRRDWSKSWSTGHPSSRRRFRRTIKFTVLSFQSRLIAAVGSHCGIFRNCTPIRSMCWWRANRSEHRARARSGALAASSNCGVCANEPLRPRNGRRRKRPSAKPSNDTGELPMKRRRAVEPRPDIPAPIRKAPRPDSSPQLLASTLTKMCDNCYTDLPLCEAYDFRRFVFFEASNNV